MTQKLKGNPAFRSIATCIAVSLTTRSLVELNFQKHHHMYSCAINDQKLKGNPTFRSITTCIYSCTTNDQKLKENPTFRSATTCIALLVKKGIKTDHSMKPFNVAQSMSAAILSVPVTTRTRACM